MLVVKVELWSAVTGKITEIARMDISNVSEVPGNICDYRARFYRGRDKDALDGSMKRQTLLRKAHVYRYARLRGHVWNLVCLSLQAAGYTKGVTPMKRPRAPLVDNEQPERKV